MSNMSYCMFENTLQDFIDCVAKLEAIGFNLDMLSPREQKAAEEMINLCHDISCAVDDSGEEE